MTKGEIEKGAARALAFLAAPRISSKTMEASELLPASAQSRLVTRALRRESERMTEMKEYFPMNVSFLIKPKMLGSLNGADINHMEKKGEMLDYIVEIIKKLQEYQ